MVEVLILILVVAVLAVTAGTALVTTRNRRGRAGGVKAPIQSAESPPDTAAALPAEALPAEALPVGVPPAEGPPAEGPPAEDLPVAAPSMAPVAEAEAALAPAKPALRDRLGKARQLIGGYLGGIRSRGIDDSTFDDLEEALLLADAGVTTTTRVLDDLRARVKSGEIEKTADGVLSALRSDLIGIFEDDSPELHFGKDDGPTVWLLVGVNGVGKTTTIGKLAKREADEGRKVVLAAGDTFRAAAGEQLETWADRSGASLVRGSEGADPSSVIFDAVQHAAARGADLVIADTAGRLHTKVNLMEELRKVRRVAEKPPGQLTEVLLVLDATTGQNGLIQAKQFTEAVSLSGVVLTKLDGTAKGGVVLAIRSELGLPIKLVGVGETVEDLIEFDANEFVSALFE